MITAITYNTHNCHGERKRDLKQMYLFLHVAWWIIGGGKILQSF